MTRDPLRIALSIGLYIFFYVAAAMVIAPVLLGLGGRLVAVSVSGFIAAAGTNALALKIYEGLPLPAIGLAWNRTSARNLGLGLAGGIGSALIVICIPLLTGLARLRTDPAVGTNWGTFAFVGLMLLAGSAGEEILFRGYGFQLLLRSLGPSATILPVGVLFAALHAGNPNSTYLGLANTAGFGILFGYAFLRSGDLWFPIGLHFGWNLVLPVMGVNVSGFTMKVTSLAVEWNVGALWSGGDYGPEGGVFASVALGLLLLYLWKVPVRRQKPWYLPPSD